MSFQPGTRALAVVYMQVLNGRPLQMHRDQQGTVHSRGAIRDYFAHCEVE